MNALPAASMLVLETLLQSKAAWHLYLPGITLNPFALRKKALRMDFFAVSRIVDIERYSNEKA